MSEKKLKLTLIKSPIGTRQSHRDTLRGLGLNHLHQTVELKDSKAIRGMVNKVSYLVKNEG